MGNIKKGKRPQTKTYKKILALMLVSVLVFSLSGCREKDPKKKPTASKTTELTIYNVFDNEDVFEPLLQAFRSEYNSTYGNIKINYRKFNDVEEYRELIIDELAEGEGPDIFFLHNSWFYKDHKKLMPAPSSVTKDAFVDTYVDVAANDLIIRNEDKMDKIYSFPLYVDTLALYYNRSYYNDVIPERGKPAGTWAELEDDIFKLKKEDNSFERFKVAGIAMGRNDNILRSVDIFLTLLLQHGAEFYDEDYDKAIFAETQGINSFGKANMPGLEALELYTSFGLPTHRNYTWNSFLSDAKSAEQEINTFARGKVGIILGYSYLYEEIARQINIIAKKNPNAIEVSDVAVAEIPQVFDPEESIGNMATLASYFAPAVSRTTENPEAAWALIGFLTNQENSRYYNSKTKRPTARRDLIKEQSEDPIYGVFVKQVGFAKSIPMVDYGKYNEIFAAMIDQVIATVPARNAIKEAQEKINELVPDEGLFVKDIEKAVNPRKDKE